MAEDKTNPKGNKGLLYIVMLVNVTKYDNVFVLFRKPKNAYFITC